MFSSLINPQQHHILLIHILVFIIINLLLTISYAVLTFFLITTAFVEECSYKYSGNFNSWILPPTIYSSITDGFPYSSLLFVIINSSYKYLYIVMLSHIYLMTHC